ncbi:MAG: zinc ribbon domain-containing protein [Anaerolineae bacterium]|nr:zinc ribbon domain-containing protein [Anaerolineae bacterium]
MTLDQATINDILLFSITISGAVVTAIWAGLVLWTWRDMGLRSRDTLARIAASLVVVVLGIFGLVIYVMLRPAETLAEAYERSLEEEALLQNIEEKPVCPGCGRTTRDNWQVCPYCHTKLKKACIACGEMLELAWNLCPYCATSQINQAARKPATPTPARRTVAARLGEHPIPPEPDFGYAPDTTARSGDRSGDRSGNPGGVDFVDDESY